MNIKQFRLLGLIALLALPLGALPLRLLYTGDTHGAYQAREIEAGRLWLGGYLALEQYLTQERAYAPRSLYLDSGDQQTGTVFASLVADGVHGGAVIDVFNRLGLDAATLGNHEFDFSYSNTRNLVRRAEYPFLSTNLIDQCTGLSVGREPWIVLERAGLRVGILGITLELLGEKVKAQNVASVDILPAKAAIGKHLDALDAASDLIVILSHQGFEADSLLALSLDHRVDLIIGGHDHIALDTPRLVNGIYLLYSGARLELLGEADLEVENDRVVSLTNTLIPLTLSNPQTATPLADFLAEKTRRVEEQMARVLGVIPEDWIPDKYASTSLSRWIAASLREEYRGIYRPELAVINNGGLRKLIPAGEVNLRDISELLPFNNTVVVFSCYGRDLIAFDELNARHAIDRPHDICEMAGLSYDAEIIKADDLPWQNRYRVNGAPLERDRVYRVVSHDYVAGQWDKYLGFQPFDVYDTGELILDAMIRQLESQYGRAESEGMD